MLRTILWSQCSYKWFWFWPTRVCCVMSDLIVDFNFIKIGVLALVLRWGIPLTFVVEGPDEGGLHLVSPTPTRAHSGSQRP